MPPMPPTMLAVSSADAIDPAGDADDDTVANVW
jgi:hypothetical protein